jgi:hypothetical protein
MPLVPFFDPATGASGGPTPGSNTISNAWVTVEDFDWTTQSTSSALVGVGTATMGGKSVTNATVAGVPTYQTQVVNGQGLVFTISAGLSGSGGASCRFDLVPANFNPGEQLLLEMLISDVSFSATGLTQLFGIGSGGHYSLVEWQGVLLRSLAGNVTTNHESRGYSTSGGARTVTVAAAQPMSTDYLVQVWYDGTYASRVGVVEGQTTFLNRPVVGAAAPFDVALDVGTTGCQTAAPAANADGLFASTLRCICGLGSYAGSFALRRYRLSRPTRM